MLKNLTKQWYQRRVREVIMDGKIANRCVICLSGITNDLAVIPDCKHNYWFVIVVFLFNKFILFSYECIMGWASKQLFCVCPPLGTSDDSSHCARFVSTLYTGTQLWAKMTTLCNI
eukprot:TRINITY_DN1870_c0_g1_i10.p1 TRINITY_DN1870_c0_g1~~TRINITY_DN1870_c0_g1_i10.p1  ORF type:complete len:116 (+),score=11.90 TRINITY_DN1870_c0_g1_i10:106-453(+)